MAADDSHRSAMTPVRSDSIAIRVEFIRDRGHA